MVEAAVADSAEKNSVGFETGSQRLLRQRRAILLNGRSTDAVCFKSKLVAANIRDRG